MTDASRFEEFDRRVTRFLHFQLKQSPLFSISVLELWKDYLSLRLPSEHFVAEFTSGKGERFSQRLWEMLLARHLDAQGYKLTSPSHGPDFQFTLDGRVVWVEAISPEPRGLPPDWMEPPGPNEWRVGTVPHDEIALRWTAAFKEKWHKLNGYQRKRVVSPDDAYIIAIHGGQLGLIPLDHGISRYPLALETVFPIGPLAMPVDQQTGKVGQPVISVRLSIRNANGSPVPTTPFVDEKYAGVSAIFAYSGDRSSDSDLAAYVVHNPFARVRIPLGRLGHNVEEWYAEPVGTTGLEIELRKYRSQF